MRRITSDEPVSVTALDRVIGYLSPSTGAARLRARAEMASMSGGYKSARRDRRQTKRWTPGEGSADADTLPDIPDLRSRSRDLARNQPLATGALKTKVTHTVGLGLVPHPTIDRKILGLDEDQAAAWERSVAREYRLWSQCADWTEQLSFEALQELVLRSALESGDVLAIKRYRRCETSPYGLRLELVEADRLSNPHRRSDTVQLAGGVQIDKAGRPIAYHISDRHPGDRVAKAMTWTAVPARFKDGRPICLHVVDRDRIGQTRGVPWLAPVIEILKELENFTEAELRAAVVAALFAVFIEKDADTGTTIADKIPAREDGSGDLKLEAGAILDLDPGEKANAANPGRPNPQFEPFVVSMIRQIGVALGLPFELMIMHFTASYSASRAALEMAGQGFLRHRGWLVRTLCNPVRDMVIEEAVALGRLVAPGFFDDPLLRAAWCGCEWVGPARMTLDPFKDARADVIDVSAGVKTRQQVCTERTGGDWERKSEQLSKENRRRQELGLSDPQGAAFDGTPNAEPKTEDDDDA